MLKVSKRDLILDSIIQAYLTSNSPIGSNELGSKMKVSIPASTIRVYFKKLSDEGAITQFHISGGRIPTVSTMKNYWREHLNFDDNVEIRSYELLKCLVREFDIYSIIFENKTQNLNEILNLNNKFLVLSFDFDEIVLKFNQKVEKFLSNLLGVSLDKLEIIAKQVGLNELTNRIMQIKNSKICFLENEKIAFEIFENEVFKRALTPNLQNMFNSNLLFLNENYVGIRCDAIFEGKQAKMICLGGIYCDYENFFNNIKEAA